MTGEIDKYKKKSGNKVGALRFISPQHHFNFNQLSRKFADVSLLAKFSLFLKKTEPGLTKMTTVVHCMFSLLIGDYIKYVYKCKSFEEA